MVFRHSQAPAQITTRNNENNGKEEVKKKPIFAVIGLPDTPPLADPTSFPPNFNLPVCTCNFVSRDFPLLPIRDLGGFSRFQRQQKALYPSLPYSCSIIGTELRLVAPVQGGLCHKALAVLYVPIQVGPVY